jgi:hypothetical protein
MNATGPTTSGDVVAAFASPVVVLRDRCCESLFADSGDVPLAPASRFAPAVTSDNTLENCGLAVLEVPASEVGGAGFD